MNLSGTNVGSFMPITVSQTSAVVIVVGTAVVVISPGDVARCVVAARDVVGAWVGVVTTCHNKKTSNHHLQGFHCYYDLIIGNE